MNNQLSLTLALLTLCLGSAAHALSNETPKDLYVQCFHDDENTGETVRTISTQVDYVVSTEGRTTGYMITQQVINLKPDTIVFSSTDRCLVLKSKN